MEAMSARYDAIADSYGSGTDDLSSPAAIAHGSGPADPSPPAALALLALLGPAAGERVLDLACGHGVVARELARRGADVVGIDLSAGLLDRARTIEAASSLGIRYELADA